MAIEERRGRRTVIIYGSDRATDRWLKFMKNVDKKMDISSDYTGLSVIHNVETYKKAYIDVKCRGGRIRFITEITKDNIAYCTELVNIVDELRHLEGLKGTVGVSETEYLSATVLGDPQPTIQLIYSTAAEVIEQGAIYITSMSGTTKVDKTERVGITLPITTVKQTDKARGDIP